MEICKSPFLSGHRSNTVNTVTVFDRSWHSFGLHDQDSTGRVFARKTVCCSRMSVR